MLLSQRQVLMPLWVSLLLSVVFNVQAKNVELHGFLAQGLIKNKDSQFVNDDNDFSTDLTEIGINAAYQLFPNIRFTGQAVYLNGGNRYDEGVRIDYLLADWNFYNDEQWQNHLYIGRIKNNHWLYSSTRDVPMTRPSIILPQSVYFDGTRDISVGGDGISLASQYSTEKYGEIDFTISSTAAAISRDDTQIIVGNAATGKLEHSADIQTSIFWQPALAPWRIGVAMTDADFDYKAGDNDAFVNGQLNLKRFYLNAEYYGEKLSLSAELLQENLEQVDLIFSGFNRDATGQGGFIQAEYQVSKLAQILIRYERYYADKNDKNGQKLEAISLGTIPHYFGYQHDATIGLEYDLSPSLRLQLEHHWIDGTARITPLIFPDAIANPKAHWQLSAVQLMYWF